MPLLSLMLSTGHHCPFFVRDKSLMSLWFPSCRRVTGCVPARRLKQGASIRLDACCFNRIAHQIDLPTKVGRGLCGIAIVGNVAVAAHR